MIVISIASLKGGVGKTASAFALADGLARGGRRVVLVDADPQASLSSIVGIDDPAGRSLTEMMLGTLRPYQVVRDLGEQLSIIPASLELARVEVELAQRYGREQLLNRLVRSMTSFDVAVIDAPPAMTILAITTIVAADGLIVPVQLDALGLHSLRLFLGEVENIRQDAGSRAELIGLMPVMVERRKHQAEALAELEGLGLPMLPSIPRAAAVSAASASRKSILSHAPRSAVGRSYSELVQEVERWEEKHRTNK